MDMKGKLDSIETSMKFLAEKYDTLLEEVVGLRNENKSLKSELDILKAKENSNQETIDKMELDLAELDQYGRRFNLEIQGLPQQPNEDILTVMDQVAKKIGVELEPHHIHQAHRLQARRDGNPPTVLVQFYSKTTRDIWLKNGRKAKLNKILFFENMCPYYRSLHKEAKNRATTHKYEFVWFSGGRVLARKKENDNIIVIRSKDDLKKIK